MKLSFAADCDWESHVGRIKSHYVERSATFESRSYGNEVACVALLFVC
jgi:hypothetical protein